VPLVQYFRSNGHPATPIVLAEGIIFGRDWIVPASAASSAASNAALWGAYQQLVASGDANVHYVNATSLFSAPSLATSPTANGLHPTDEGIVDIAAFWVPFLEALVGA